MANFSLSWTPQPNGNSTGQDIKSRGKTAGGAYAVKASVGTTVSTYSPLSLSDNLVHQVLVCTNCSVGGPADSNVVELVGLTCVGTVTITPAETSGTVSFAALGGDVDTYTINLKQGASILFTATKPTAGTVTHSFTGLSPSTAYDVEVVAKIATAYSKACIKGTLTTSASPCLAPTGLTGTPI
jgi:hypothetical protein